MRTAAVPILIFGIVLAGCTTKTTADAKARAAFLAGQQKALAAKTDPNSVWVVGNVQNPLIPWTQELTLAKAIIAAEYRGVGDPSQIVLLRNGQPSVFVSATQLLNGFDLPTEPGDRIEIRP
jgi:hypothetical protein